MSLSYESVKDNPKQLRAMTGHDKAEIEEQVLPLFEQADKRQEVKRKVSRPRQRVLGGGRKAKLSTSLERLFFILVYVKTAPLQEAMAVQFGMSQSRVNLWVHRLMPVLEEALEQGGYAPIREPSEVKAALANSPESDFVLDGTERPRGRPVDEASQRAHYSGKKRTHTVTNSLLIERHRQWVVYLSQSYPGKTHDKKITDLEPLALPEPTLLSQDSGFQGHHPQAALILQPKKKPPKKARPIEDKVLNRAISALRIPVEHAISGIKRMRIVKDRLRLTKERVADRIMLIACGLHNLRVEARYPNPFDAPPLTAYCE